MIIRRIRVSNTNCIIHCRRSRFINCTFSISFSYISNIEPVISNGSAVRFVASDNLFLNEMQHCNQSLVEPYCSAQSVGSANQLFATLIQTLLATQCSISPQAMWPDDYGVSGSEQHT